MVRTTFAGLAAVLHAFQTAFQPLTGLFPRNLIQRDAQNLRAVGLNQFRQHPFVILAAVNLLPIVKCLPSFFRQPELLFRLFRPRGKGLPLVVADEQVDVADFSVLINQ